MCNTEYRLMKQGYWHEYWDFMGLLGLAADVKGLMSGAMSVYLSERASVSQLYSQEDLNEEIVKYELNQITV